MVEPKYPGAVEEYVNLGRAYQREGLQEVKGELMSCMTGYKACYQRAYRCLGAAAAIQEDLRATLTTPALEERLAKIGRGRIVDGVGRGIALDRDGNYQKIRKAYECLTLGKGTTYR